MLHAKKTDIKILELLRNSLYLSFYTTSKMFETFLSILKTWEVFTITIDKQSKKLFFMLENMKINLK